MTAPLVQIAKQGAEARDWSWVEASVWTDRMLSALSNGVKGGVWYSLMDKVYAPATLTAAWEKVRANDGAAGVDRQSMERFAANSEVYLAELSRELRTGEYRPAAIRRVMISKGNGGMRPLGIPTVKDRIAQTAVKFALEPILEAQFHAGSFGFRPGRGCKDALREVDRLVKSGHCFVVDADLKSYFDSIPHDKLMARLRTWVSDGRVLELVERWLKQEIVSECERWTPTGGTPQGAVISPLLANLYRRPLDVLMGERGFSMVRYADDFVVLCESPEQAQEALALIRFFTDENGLTAASGQDPCRRLPDQGAGVRVPGLSLRGGTPARPQEEYTAPAGEDQREDEAHERAKSRAERSPRSIRCSKGGSTTSSTRPRVSRTSTRSYVGGFGRCCASKRKRPRLRQLPQ